MFNKDDVSEFIALAAFKTRLTAGTGASEGSASFQAVTDYLI